MIGTNLTRAKKLLEDRQIVAIPTETVYGLAAHAFNMPAVNKLFEIKQRPKSKPLIIQTHSLAKVEELVAYMPPEAKKMAYAFWPGPLTLLLEKKSFIPDLITSGTSKVGIRIPNQNTTLKLLESLSFPLVVTSANISGQPSCITAEEVQNQLGNQIPYILDGGKCQLRLESTIIGFDANLPKLYRLGAISQPTIEKVIGKT
ncbi:MAG: L-threonylcarbamoyladenylate synthase [Bacteroidota bacterium]